MRMACSKNNVTVQTTAVFALTSEITPKNVRGNNVDFWASGITSKKVRRNDEEIRRNFIFDVST